LPRAGVRGSCCLMFLVATLTALPTESDGREIACCVTVRKKIGRMTRKEILCAHRVGVCKQREPVIRHLLYTVGVGKILYAPHGSVN